MIRRADPRDATSCAAIMREWIVETDWFPSLHAAAEDTPFIMSKIDKGHVWVDEGGLGLTGFMALEEDFLSCLYVARPHRRRGVGRRLLDHAKGETPRFTLWTFEANEAARLFYSREGLRETGRTDGDNDEGLPDIEFTWDAEGA
jgi:GNAT superfamily N-acetyltransferase